MTTTLTNTTQKKKKSSSVLMVLFSILRTCALALITFPIAFVLHVFAVFLLPWEITKATASEIFSHHHSMKKTKTKTNDDSDDDIPKLRRRNSSKTDSKYSYLREVFLIGTGGNRPSLDDFDDALILRVGILLLGVVFVLIILLASAHIICISFVHFDFSKVVTRNINKRFTHIITSRKERRRSAQPVKDDNINEST